MRKGGFELLYHIDNTQLIDFAFGLTAQIPHNPASIVRLSYGERAQKRKPRRSAFSQSRQQQFDTRQSHRSRPPFENAAVRESIGPFQQTVVPNGTIAGTGLPLVLISHGTAGSEASHYDTALALADEGFVAATLTLTGDNYMDQSYVGNREDLTPIVLLCCCSKERVRASKPKPGRIG